MATTLRFPLWLAYKHADKEHVVSLHAIEGGADLFCRMHKGSLRTQIDTRASLLAHLQIFEDGGYPGVKMVEHDQWITVTFQQVRDLPFVETPCP